MKNRYLGIVSALLLLCMMSCTLLTSCAPSYKKYHTEENVAITTAVGGSKAIAYFFLLEDGSAVMDICREDGKRLQRIELAVSCEYYASLDFSYSFTNAAFQDMDFDGEMDLYIPCSVTTANLEGMAWLWDDEKGQFVLSEELSKLYELTIYPEDEIIASQDFSDPENIVRSEYKWENDKLVKIDEYIVDTPA